MLTSNKGSNVKLNGQRQYEKEWRIQQMKLQFDTFFNQTNSYDENRIESRKETDKNTRIIVI